MRINLIENIFLNLLDEYEYYHHIYFSFSLHFKIQIEQEFHSAFVLKLRLTWLQVYLLHSEKML